MGERLAARQPQGKRLRTCSIGLVRNRNRDMPGPSELRRPAQEDQRVRKPGAVLRKPNPTDLHRDCGDHPLLPSANGSRWPTKGKSWWIDAGSCDRI